MTLMEKYSQEIVACYLYVITKYGYPPDAARSVEHLREYGELGFRSIELEGIRREHLEEMDALGRLLRQEADGLDLKIPVFCVVLPGLSSPDPDERERNLELFGRGCDLAVTLGAHAVLDNAPLPPWVFPGEIPVTRHYGEKELAGASLPERLKWEKYREGLVETYRDACDIAAGRRLTFHLHPCLGALVQTTDAYLNFAEAVKRDNLRFNLDTANQFYMRDHLSLSLLRLQGHVDYIHISDNRGDRVEHLVPGTGKIDWDRFFETLDRIGFRGMFGIDVGGAESDVPDLDRAYRSTAAWLTEKWFKHKS
jgi:sugar phosphate isomerase/epimerase